jgi:UDP-N-acetylmuramoyl-tripeptide--D-alanyl-D-alanine ligase
MRELGEESARFHAELAEPIAAARVDLAILVGEEMTPLAETLGRRMSLAHVADAAAAIAELRRQVAPGDAILVKGSNSIGLSALVEALANGTG